MTSIEPPPRLVLLFSGHRVDAPGRARPRFPPALVPSAAVAVGAALDALGAGAADLALSQAAAGGDLLFSEACLARGVHLRWMLPVPEAEFITRSVRGSAGAEDWPARYRALKARLADPPIVMAAAHGNAFERANRWLVERALSYGTDKLRFICMWDGAAAGDGAGGTAQMVDEVRRHAPRMTWIDTRSLGAPASSAAP
jgi:hypothetical protein